LVVQERSSDGGGTPPPGFEAVPGLQLENWAYNADMSHRQTRQFCVLDNECSNLLKGAMTEMVSRLWSWRAS